MSFNSSGQLSQLCPHPISLLAEQQSEKQSRPQRCASTDQQQLKHWHVINTVLVTKLKHNIIQASMKEINSMPARPRTPSEILSCKRGTVSLSLNYAFVPFFLFANSLKISY